MLALGIDYLTGYASATDSWDRTRAEWPPHPGRVFMAMAAAYFETKPLDSDPSGLAAWHEQAEALRWLEGLPPPEMAVSGADRRDVLDVYVPPNDMGANKKTAIPIFRTNRQPRAFPKVRPHSTDVYLIWADANPSKAQLSALQSLCEKVIRIGHSSSFVRMWIADKSSHPASNLVPADELERRPILNRLRVVASGALDYLKNQFNGQANERFFELAGQIQVAKGKAKKELQAIFEEEFGSPWKRSMAPPLSLRPVMTLTQEYVDNEIKESAAAESWFDTNMVTLAQYDGPMLGLESSWLLTSAMRGAIEKLCQPTPEWISGHQPDGTPSEAPHLAIAPLAFVGSQYADGHILGLGLVFPRSIRARDRGKALRNLLYNSDGAPAEIRLTLGRVGECSFRLEDRATPPRALQPETWTAAPEGAKTWASVTPVVLDRHPKTDPLKERGAWNAEVSRIIAASCERVGLPEPSKIDVDKTSWLRGAPRAKPGSNGYPLMPQRSNGANRRQVHIWLRFNQPLQGPVLLGSGRYRGYGLCKPVIV